MAFDRIKKAVMQTLDKLLNEQYPGPWHQTATSASVNPPNPRDYEQRRILELADGRPVYEIVSKMYAEEIINSMGYVVLSQRSWKDSLARKIEKLAEEGYLKLERKEAA